MRREDHRCGNTRSQAAVRHRKGDSLSHRWVFHEHLVHFFGDNLFPPTVDNLLETPGDKQIALGIHIAFVAGAEPSIRSKSAPGRLGVIFIALHYIRATHDDFATHPYWQHSSCLIDDGDFWSYGYSNGTRLALTWW